jgi:hypothetical protein
MLVTLLGLALRLQHLGAIEHNVDHAYPIWQAQMTLASGHLPLTAQGTSVLFANPPLTGYLFIPGVMLTGSPVGAYLIAIVFNSAAIWLTYRVGVVLLDRPRGLIAAFLLAVNPWVVEYSRTTWVQSLLPGFAVLIVWLLVPVLLGTARKPGRRLLLALLTITAATQTYLLAFAFLIPVSGLLLLFRERLRGGAIVAGGVVFLSVTGAYAAGLWQQRDEAAARITSFASGESRLSGEAWSHALRLVTGADYPAARGLDAPIRDAERRQRLTDVLHGLLVITMFVGVLRSLPRPSRRDLIPVIWLVALPTLMSYVSRPVHPFYLLLTLPAGHLLAANGVGLLLRWRLGVLAVIVGGVGVGVLHGVNTVRYAQETVATPGAHGLSALPLSVGMDMTRRLIPDAALKPGAVVFADVDGWLLNSLRGRLFPVDRQVARDQITFAPVGGGVYLEVVEVVAVAADEMRGTTDAADVAETVVWLADGTGICGSPAPRAEVYAQGRAEIPSDLGISYLGAEVITPPVPGGAVRLITRWRIAELHPERGGWLLGAFVHVRTATGERVAIGSGAVVPGGGWRVGDVHLVRLDVDIPAEALGPFTLHVGQYDGVHGLNAIFTLADGSHSPLIPVNPVTP